MKMPTLIRNINKDIIIFCNISKETIKGYRSKKASMNIDIAKLFDIKLFYNSCYQHYM